MKQLSILVLVVFIFVIDGCVAEKKKRDDNNIDKTPFVLTTIITRNSLGKGKRLSIHCKSRDDDLGSHVVPYKKTYNFTFRPNFWRTTLFFCGVASGYGKARYDAYKDKRDYNRCRTMCLWDATPKGIYGYKQMGDHQQDLFIAWSKSISNSSS